MIVWYNVYSFWVVGLFILYISGLIKFSIVPSVIGACVGTIIFLLWKIYDKIPMNVTFVLVQVILHIFPFFILPFKFTQTDIIINTGIFIFYLLWLKIQNLNFYALYDDIVHEDGRVTLIGYAKRRGLL